MIKATSGMFTSALPNELMGMIAKSFDCPRDLKTFIDAFPEFESEFLPIYEASVRKTYSVPAIKWATYCRDYNLIQRLVAHGADVNEAEGSRHRTALHAAADCGYYNIVELLLQSGANVDARDVSGATPLHGAANMRHYDILGLLLGNGADIGARDVRGRTVLHHAVASFPGCERYSARERALWEQLGLGIYRPQILGLLLRKGAEINAQDVEGRTALHYSTVHDVECYQKISKFLVDRGADVTIHDYSQLGLGLVGVTAFEEAFFRGHINRYTLSLVQLSCSRSRR